ncbi:hypothetical protein JMM81_15830 [Bacillus sp. V3B]|uniref:hypothetical protein n=1 Tax=Bacillus sp. V3B TaxID=2804915 RepID=UPI00210D8987|nr:hypothetical protein [Bacillus sp. V3B]MCQ6276385.1 hypothetical protein [Bacillus sp. V3B]
MKSKTTQNYEKLKVIYEENLSVDLLAEDISICNSSDNSLFVKEEMSKRDFDVYGVKDNGKLTRYVLREELGEGVIKDYYRPFHSEDLISDSTSLIELLDILRERSYIFILEKNKVSKIVTVADLHKQPIRMLAFSLISLLEMHLTALISHTYLDGSWTQLLSEERLGKAQEMLQKRLEKNQALTLLDNTQLGDKGTIVRKTPDLIQKLGFDSTSKCKEFFKNIEVLRNNTAHAQEEIYHDYQEFIELILQIDRVLERHVTIEETWS